MRSEILDVHPFPQPTQGIECLILPLQAIFSRRDQYRMDLPQRLHSYMMTLFTRGHGEHTVDFVTYAYQAGTLLFVAQNQMHQWQINLQNDGLTLAFSVEFLYKSEQDRRLLEGYRIFDYALQNPIMTLDPAEYASFLTLFHEMQAEFTRSDPDSFQPDILRNLLRTILLRAERLKRAEAQPAVLSHYQDFVRFKERVEQDFIHTRNVKDYARALGYSSKKLNQLSQVVLNKGAKSFIDERVILEIKRLLIHTTFSIKEITEHVGFDEPTNLVKFFKRYTGRTPRNFRNEIGLS